MASTINGTSTGSGGLISTGDDSGILNIQTNETTAITIDASQNVGIGTSSPAANYKLSVNGTGNFYNGVAGLGRVFLGDPADSSGYIGVYRSTLGPSNSTTAGNGLNFASIDGYTFNTAAAAFGSQTERMRIDSSGNLLVGTTSSVLATARATFSTSGSAGIVSAVSSNTNLYCVNTSASSWTAINFRHNTSTEVGTINCTSTATSYNTSSDYRLKNTVAPMTGALAKVALLKPVTYKWNVDNSDGQGFIAHELQELCPGAVTGKKDDVETYTDEDGNEQTRIKPQGIDTSFLVATLTAAIQEQQVLITAQAETINALTARIVALDETLTEIKDRFPK